MNPNIWVLLSVTLKDDKNMIRQMRYMYARSNGLLRMFSLYSIAGNLFLAVIAIPVCGRNINIYFSKI